MSAPIWGKSARPAPGTFVCRLDEIDEPGAKGMKFKTEDAYWLGLVVRHEGKVAGYVDSCPHAGWALSTLSRQLMTRDGRYLICTGHGALFRPGDGTCAAGPCLDDALEPWPLDVRDGDIFVA